MYFNHPILQIGRLRPWEVQAHFVFKADGRRMFFTDGTQSQGRR